jgi:hypothetical protein
LQPGRDGITGFWNNRRIWVTDNLIQEPGDDGIAVNASDKYVGRGLAEDIHISGNQIENGRHFGRGIMLSGVRRALVANNTIRSVVSSGIAIEPNTLTGERSSEVDLIGNRITEAGADPASKQPLVSIRIASSDDVRVLSNILEAGGTQALFATDCGNLTLSANVASAWGRAVAAPGFDLRSIVGLRVSGNMLSAGSAPGILLDAPTSARLVANTIELSGVALVARGSIRDCVVSGNLFINPHMDQSRIVSATDATAEAMILAANTIVAAGGNGEFSRNTHAVGNSVVSGGS